MARRARSSTGSFFLAFALAVSTLSILSAAGCSFLNLIPDSAPRQLRPGDKVQLLSGLRMECPPGWAGWYTNGLEGSSNNELLNGDMPEGASERFPLKIEEVSLRLGAPFEDGPDTASPPDDGTIEVSVYRPRAKWLDVEAARRRIAKRLPTPQPAEFGVDMTSSVPAKVTASASTSGSDDGLERVYIRATVEISGGDPVEIDASMKLEAARRLGISGSPRQRVAALLKLIRLKLP